MSQQVPLKHSEPSWIDAGGGYWLTLIENKVVARNPKGQILQSLPKQVKDLPLTEQLRNVAGWLVYHQAECVEQLEQWMLRSLPIPTSLVIHLWDDPAWNQAFTNTVMVPVDASSRAEFDQAGLLKAVDRVRGLGVVGLEGETRWLFPEQIVIPHPVYLTDLQDWRELCIELGEKQVLQQLFREIWIKPDVVKPDPFRFHGFANAEFEQLNHALSRCRSLGIRIRQGFASQTVWDRGTSVEVMFWVGEGYPENPTSTGHLGWRDGRGRLIPVPSVGPIAFSEGCRLAQTIVSAAKQGVPEPPATEHSKLGMASSVSPHTWSPLSTDDILAAGGMVIQRAEQQGIETIDLVAVRTYHHPALGQQRVRRFSTEKLGFGLDREMELLGFQRTEITLPGAYQNQRAPGFPAWALVYVPDQVELALSTAKELKALRKVISAKPKNAKDRIEFLARPLVAADPRLLPTFYEEAGRMFLEAGNEAFALQLFNKAREAERVYGLTVDETQRRQAYLEFAEAGVLSPKALTDFGKDLLASPDVKAAYDFFRDLCYRRTLAGVTPWPEMPKTLRALAKAAGLDAGQEEAELVQSLLELPILRFVASAFWKQIQPTLIKLAKQSPAIRGTLLNLFPLGGETSLPPRLFDIEWLELLEACGALEALTLPDEQVPTEAKPHSGPTEWLNRMVNRALAYRTADVPKPLLTLLTRMAEPLKSEKVTVSFEVIDRSNQRWGFASLVEVALEHGIPVADPAPDVKLTIGLAHDVPYLVQDKRFFPLLIDALDDLIRQRSFAQSVQGKPGFQKARRAWYLNQIKILQASPLSRFEKVLDWLRDSVTPDLFQDFPELVEKLAAITGSEMLARTFQGGIWDEYGWPELEAVIDEMTANGSPSPAICGFFPYAVVASWDRAVVVGPTGRIFDHQLQLPPDARLGNLAFADGQLLVTYRSQDIDWGYWSGTPSDRFQTYISSCEMLPRGALVELPGIGVTTGKKVCHAGDPNPDFTFGYGRVYSDGLTVWRTTYNARRDWLCTFDPQTGEEQSLSLPAFFDEFQAPEWILDVKASQLLPLPPGLESTLLGHKDGLIGSRSRHLHADDQKILRQGEFQGIDGRRWSGTFGHPFSIIGMLPIPGTNQFHLVCGDQGTLAFWDEIGQIPAFEISLREFRPNHAKGTACVFPFVWLHCLKVRDEAGSRFLRQFPVETANQLLRTALSELNDWKTQTGPVLPLSDITLDNIPELARDFPHTWLKLEALVPEGMHQRLKIGMHRLVVEASRAVSRLARLVGPAYFHKVSAPQPAPAVEFPPRYNFERAFKQIIPHNYAWRFCRDLNQELLTIHAYLAGLEPADVLQPKLPQGYNGTGIGWIDLIGNLGMVGFLVATAYQSPEEKVDYYQYRETRLKFLEAWSDTIFASEPEKIRVLYGRITVPEATAAEWQKLDHATLVEHEGNRYFVRTYNEYYIEHSGISYTAIEYAPDRNFKELPGTSIVNARRNGGWLGRDNIRKLVNLVKTRGTVAWDSKIADLLSRGTGLSRNAAAVLWLGFPGFEGHDESRFFPASLREQLGMKVLDVNSARIELEKMCPVPIRLPLWSDVLPDEIETLWTPLGTGETDSNSVVHRLMAAWNRHVGKQIEIPAELVATITKEKYYTDIKAVELLTMLANPAQSEWLHDDQEWRLFFPSTWLTYSYPVGCDWAKYNNSKFFRREVVTSWSILLPYLFVTLPVGDPLRSNLPALMHLIWERLKNPNFFLPLDYKYFHASHGALQPQVDAFFDQFGDVPYVAPQTPANEQHHGIDAGDSVALLRKQDDKSAEVEVFVRTGRIPNFERLEEIAAMVKMSLRLESLFPFTQGCRDLVARIEQTPVPAGQYECNPLYSAPHVVSEIAEAFRLSPDAATLGLQTLALIEPSTRNICLWNGWNSARYKKAASELVAAEIVIEAKRERAGRNIFLPGVWISPKPPDEPIEQWKLELYGAKSYASNSYWKPLKRLLPLRPIHEIFELAWTRIKERDHPG